jgi:4-amino-4-deoxy-L-arabinose transferase
MPLVVALGRVGTLDALLAVHVLAIVALDLGGPRGEHSAHRAVAAGALLGLAFLVKGPVGVVLPLGVVLAGRAAARRTVWPQPRSMVRAGAACVVVVLPWTLAFVRAVGLERAMATLRGEVFERYFAGGLHIEPPWYYAGVAAAAFLPWLAPLSLGLVRAWHWRRSPVARTALYAGAGLLAGLVFLSLGQDKLPSYILPLAPLAALVVTWELARETDDPARRTLGPNLLAATIGGCAVLFVLAARHLDGLPRVVSLTGAAIYAAGALGCGMAAARRRPRSAYAWAAATAGTFLLLASWWLFPHLARQRSSAGLIQAVPALRSARSIATVEVKVPSLTFYLDRAPEVLEWDDLEQRLGRGDDLLLVFADVDLPTVPEAIRARLEELGAHGKYRVFRQRRPPIVL